MTINLLQLALGAALTVGGMSAYHSVQNKIQVVEPDFRALSFSLILEQWGLRDVKVVSDPTVPCPRPDMYHGRFTAKHETGVPVKGVLCLDLSSDDPVQMLQDTIRVEVLEVQVGA